MALIFHPPVSQSPAAVGSRHPARLSPASEGAPFWKSRNRRTSNPRDLPYFEGINSELADQISTPFFLSAVFLSRGTFHPISRPGVNRRPSLCHFAFFLHFLLQPELMQAFAGLFPAGAIFEQGTEDIQSAFKFAMLNHNSDLTNKKFELLASVDIIKTADVFKLSRLSKSLFLFFFYF